jgi:hypothetical protein
VSFFFSKMKLILILVNFTLLSASSEIFFFEANFIENCCAIWFSCIRPVWTFTINPLRSNLGCHFSSLKWNSYWFWCFFILLSASSEIIFFLRRFLLKIVMPSDSLVSDQCGLSISTLSGHINGVIVPL